LLLEEFFQSVIELIANIREQTDIHRLDSKNILIKGPGFYFLRAVHIHKKMYL